MIKSTISTLLATAALVSSTCLTPNPSSCSCDMPTAAKNSRTECCPNPHASGSEKVGSIDFEYTCGKYPRLYDIAAGLPAATADLCATLCAANPSCAAAGWNPSSRLCHLSTDTSGDTTYRVNSLLLTKTNFISPTNQCEEEVQEAVTKAQETCTGEKDALKDELAQCKAASDPACWGNGGANLCTDSCTQQDLVVDGKKFQKRCDFQIDAFVGQELFQPIRDCIQQCSQQSDCVGVQGNPAGTSCWVYNDQWSIQAPRRELGWTLLLVA
ncbi:hypothetical protein AFLA70_409g000991 [Aspergillus flavus AF70]|nr:hypothetical protein AFLA70_409g000991 [Aspergillus flavus AF70]